MILLATYCSRSKKRVLKAPAHELYKGPWIKALYKISQKFRVPFTILSAKYGLVSAEEELRYYDKKLSADEVERHSEVVANQLIENNVEEVIFYGNSKEYNKCIINACEKAKVKLKVLPKSENTKRILGFATLAGISEILDCLSKNLNVKYNL